MHTTLIAALFGLVVMAESEGVQEEDQDLNE
jgi:hypothetical protein